MKMGVATQMTKRVPITPIRHSSHDRKDMGIDSSTVKISCRDNTITNNDTRRIGASNTSEVIQVSQTVSLVCLVGITDLGEAVNDPARGCGVEKGHGQSQHVGQQAVVQDARGGDAAVSHQQGPHKEQQTCRTGRHSCDKQYGNAPSCKNEVSASLYIRL